MASYAKVLLSASTNGRNIIISASGSSGANTIHQAIAGDNDKDELWLYANNSDEDYIDFYLLWGGTTQPNDLVHVSIPPNAGPVLIIPGWVINGALYIKAYAETANKITVNGFVNRITSGS